MATSTRGPAPPRQVVVAREADRLRRALRARRPIEALIADGAAAHCNVERRHVYFDGRLELDDISRAVEAQAAVTLKDSLLMGTPVLASVIAGRLKHPSISKAAAALFVHQALRGGRLAGIGMLNRRLLPYVAAYRIEDARAVDTQLAAVRDLARRGDVHARDLPPVAGRERDGMWREIMLGHAEFLGLGVWVRDDDRLVSWVSS
jgi:hypothetical protein